MRVLFVSAALVAALLAGCSKKAANPDPGPACPDIVDHMLEVMKGGLTGHDTVALGNRDQMIAQCEQRKMSREERTCLREAKDLSGLASCKKYRPATTPDPSRTVPLGAPGGRAAPPAPADNSAPTGSAGSGG